VARSLTSPEKRPVRLGKKQIGGYFEPNVHDKLSELAFKLTRTTGHKVTIQALLEEALDDLVIKHQSHLS
jgi:hypothetical protein